MSVAQEARLSRPLCCRTVLVSLQCMRSICAEAQLHDKPFCMLHFQDLHRDQFLCLFQFTPVALHCLDSLEMIEVNLRHNKEFITFTTRDSIPRTPSGMCRQAAVKAGVEHFAALTSFTSTMDCNGCQAAAIRL